MASNPQQEPRAPRPPNQAGRGQGPSHGPRSHSQHRPKPGGWQPGPNEEGNRGKNQGGQGGNQKNSKPQPQTLPDFSKAKSGMECPVCMDMMKAPIYMCEGGHSFCDKCTLSFTPPVCPLCRAKMTLLRNFSLESILNQVSVLCPNSMFGCDHRCLEDELPSHYQSCSFKQTFCPMARIRNEVKCSWHGIQEELFNHMKDAHKSNVTLEFGRQILFQNFSVAKADSDLQVMRFQRNLFLYHVRIEPSEGLAYWAVQLVGPASAASEWKYELHVYDAAQPMKKVLITEPCTADGEDVPALFASGRCAALPLKLVSHFVRNNRFTFKVFVYNTKAPDTSDMKPLMDALPNAMPKKNMYQKNKK